LDEKVEQSEKKAKKFLTGKEIGFVSRAPYFFRQNQLSFFFSIFDF
jgi:hypothetical protein